MSGFCPHEWHQTTETDLQHMALDPDFWLFGGEALIYPDQQREARLRAHDALANEAHRLAEQRGLIPYTAEVFEGLMREVEVGRNEGGDDGE